MGIGLFISFRILRFADLTSEVAFTIGAATSVTAITHHVHPIVATLIAIIAGMIAGLITGILMTYFDIPRSASTAALSASSWFTTVP